jgi:hypothetical protein
MDREQLECDRPGERRNDQDGDDPHDRRGGVSEPSAQRAAAGDGLAFFVDVGDGHEPQPEEVSIRLRSQRCECPRLTRMWSRVRFVAESSWSAEGKVWA